VPEALVKPAYCIAALRISPIHARLCPARSAALYVDSAAGVRVTAAERLGLDLWGTEPVPSLSVLFFHSYSGGSGE
jgi:hypothetical protein